MGLCAVTQSEVQDGLGLSVQVGLSLFLLVLHIKPDEPKDAGCCFGMIFKIICLVENIDSSTDFLNYLF